MNRAPHETTDPGRELVIQIDVSALEADEGSRTVSEELTRATARRERFAAVIRMPADPGPRGRRLANVGERVRMLKRLRPGLREWCRGLAFVVSVQTQREHSKTINAGARLWGCPTFTTDDPDLATTWAYDRLDTAPPGEEGPR